MKQKEEKEVLEDNEEEEEEPFIQNCIAPVIHYLECTLSPHWRWKENEEEEALTQN